LKAGNKDLASSDGLIPWKIREQNDWGEVLGVRRETGTVQKDWVVIKSHQLPEDFCIAVRGHPGWDKDPDASARYALTVSFEAIDEDLEIYSHIETSVRALVSNSEIEAEVRTR
jgi:hypothetical protein